MSVLQLQSMPPEIYLDARLFGNIGLAMQNIGKCTLCRKPNALMYGVYSDSGVFGKRKPIAICQDCLHTGGMFYGALKATAKVLERETK